MQRGDCFLFMHEAFQTQFDIFPAKNTLNLAFFGEKRLWNEKICLSLRLKSGEKSGFNDALAYYFALD